MVKIIYGRKGTGKTKQIIDAANQSMAQAKGNIVYVTDSKEYTLQIKHQIRYINSIDYSIGNQDRLIGLQAGLMAGNTDIEHIFIDGAARMCQTELKEMKPLYDYLGRLSTEFGVNFTLTVSAALDDIPDFIRSYIS